MYNANSSQIKKILSLVRDGDYAHAGEEEAIDLVFSEIPKNKNQLLLDVGCGLGGTANYLQQQGFGKVIGIDVDLDTLLYAKNKYPDIAFYNADVINIAEIIKQPVDVIYMLNAFYAFTDQSEALSALNKIAHKNTRLVMFDYTVPAFSSVARKTVRTGKPINLTLVENVLLQTGWRVQKSTDLSAEYQRWYAAFVQKIVSKKAQILVASNEDVYQFVYKTYSNMLNDIESRLLGGSVIYAAVDSKYA